MLVITLRSLRFLLHLCFECIYHTVTYSDSLTTVSHLSNKAKVPKCLL